MGFSYALLIEIIHYFQGDAGYQDMLDCVASLATVLSLVFFR